MDLTNRDLLLCAAGCKAAGRDSFLELASVGFLGRLRAVSFSCPACGHTTAVALRSGSFDLPEPGRCWNCSVAAPADGQLCRSCGVAPDVRSGRADGAFFTFAADELGPLADEDAERLRRRLGEARRESRLLDALRAADALTHAVPDDPLAWRAKAGLYLERGYLPLALHAFKKALVLAPDDLDTLLDLGTVLELLEEPEAAGSAIRRATQLAPGEARAWAALASLEEKLERYPAAEESAGRAVELDPARADAWATLATLAMRRKDHTTAVAAWDRVLAAAADFPVAWRYKGFCHLALGQWDEAIAAGHRAGTDDPDALELVFEACLNRGDATAALAHARRCVERVPDDPRWLYLVARAHMALGQHAEGLAICDRILELSPDASWARKARAAFATRLAPPGAEPATR